MPHWTGLARSLCRQKVQKADPAERSCIATRHEACASPLRHKGGRLDALPSPPLRPRHRDPRRVQPNPGPGTGPHDGSAADELEGRPLHERQHEPVRVRGVPARRDLAPLSLPHLCELRQERHRELGQLGDRPRHDPGRRLRADAGHVDLQDLVGLGAARLPARPRGGGRLRFEVPRARRSARRGGKPGVAPLRLRDEPPRQ